jgi:hypothetical protein
VWQCVTRSIGGTYVRFIINATRDRDSLTDVCASMWLIPKFRPLPVVRGQRPLLPTVGHQRPAAVGALGPFPLSHQPQIGCVTSHRQVLDQLCPHPGQLAVYCIFDLRQRRPLMFASPPHNLSTRFLEQFIPLLAITHSSRASFVAALFSLINRSDAHPFFKRGLTAKTFWPIV